MIRLTATFSVLTTGLICWTGCDKNNEPPPVEHKQTDVKLGGGRIGVEVDKDKTGRPKVDVEAGGGKGVDVNVKK